MDTRFKSLISSATSKKTRRPRKRALRPAADTPPRVTILMPASPLEPAKHSPAIAAIEQRLAKLEKYIQETVDGIVEDNDERDEKLAEISKQLNFVRSNVSEIWGEMGL